MHCVPLLRGICIAVPVAFPDGFSEPPAVSSAVPRALATASMHSVSQNGSAPAISIQVLSASIMMHCTLLRQFRIAFLHCCCRVFGRSVLNVALHDALLSVRHRLFLSQTFRVHSLLTPSDVTWLWVCFCTHCDSQCMVFCGSAPEAGLYVARGLGAELPDTARTSTSLGLCAHVHGRAGSSSALHWTGRSAS